MDIGAKIKRIRLSNQLTLEELANRSELTKGFLSQLERDLTSPSVATLENILEALGTNLKDFFSEDEDEQIVFSKDDFFENIYCFFLSIWLAVWNKYLFLWRV